MPREETWETITVKMHGEECDCIDCVHGRGHFFKTCLDCEYAEKIKDVPRFSRCWWCGLGTPVQFWLWKPALSLAGIMAGEKSDGENP